MWGVCLVTQVSIYRAQGKFLGWRFLWLKELPCPRATTVLVEGIPEEYRSDAKLREFFSSVFSPDDIKDVHVVKYSQELAHMVAKRDAATQKKQNAEMQWAKGGARPIHLSLTGQRVDSINHYTQESAEWDLQARTERARIRSTADEVGGVNAHSGFVTFYGRREAEITQNLRFSSNRDQWVVSVPPEPSSVIWKDLRQNEHFTKIRAAIGYACLLGLYIGFVPICVFITSLAIIVKLPGPLQPIWAAFAPTLGLMLFLSFLPTVMLLIFRRFFLLKADAWSQHQLQNWYFWFQVVFVILVTAVGQSVVGTIKELVQQPGCTFSLLANALPRSTHYYMNFLVLQWAAHAQDSLRYMNLGKFLVYKAMGYPEEEASNMAEPEDQDYYGMGSRSARFTISMLLGLIYSTMTPLIALLALIKFAVCRLIYGYLIVFAETKKPDLGGAFWVTQLRHVLLGVILYCVVMLGMLAKQAPNYIPVYVAAPSLVYMVWCYVCFGRQFDWEKLPFNALLSTQITQSRSQELQAYLQPELLNSVNSPSPPAPPTLIGHSERSGKPSETR